MNARGDRRVYANEDLVLRVRADSKRQWDETKFEAFLDELCGFREYQKDAIRTALRFLLGGQYKDLRSLAAENFERNDELKERYGSKSAFEKSLQLPDQLSCSLDLATGTGKSYVLYGIANIMLAAGMVDRVLLLCPSTTIEDGLLTKFRGLASLRDLQDSLPDDAQFRVPHIIDASQSIVPGSICIENYHAILENVGSSIRQSLTGNGATTLVLNDEAHHIGNEAGGTVKKWKEFLQDPAYGFRYVVGVSGTCYIKDDYFSDVIFRYSLRQAIEEGFVKNIEYVDELPPAAEEPDQKWQLIRKRHEFWRKKLKTRKIKPLTIVVTRDIAMAERVGEELRDFLQEAESITAETADQKVICVTSAAKHQPNLAKLRTVDNSANPVEWIVSVSMLSEGWDVKNVFQIVPHEERAFNSKLLIAQVLGRGLRKPDGWSGEPPIVTVFNHDAWSARIRHLVNEVLEIERRLTASTISDSPFNFDLHQLDYQRREDSSEYAKKGEYRLFEDGYIELPTQVESEDVTVEFEKALGRDKTQFKARIEHKTWSVDDVAEQMFQRLRSIDEESKDEPKKEDRTEYAKKFPYERCQEIVRESLIRARVRGERVTDDNRQKFLQALGPLRRRKAKRVVYKLAPNQLVTVSTADRQSESCSAADLRRGAKSIVYTSECLPHLPDEQKEFFQEVDDPDGEFARSTVKISNSANFRTPVSFVIADASPERRFLRELTNRENAATVDAWLKNAPVGFYSVEYAWKKGEHPKRGEFSPDFFIKQGDRIFVVEIKGDEEIPEPSQENIKKWEYASEHFDRLNQWLAKAKDKRTYQFNMLTPKSFNIFFQKLREGELSGFRSDLDVAVLGAK